MELGRLTKLDLRSYWKKEDTDFTPWLAREENIKLLSETIDIELEVQGQEESVGPFRADILCLDTINNHFVLIENQLEKTDHNHLGQLMTYAAGLDAVTIIWIAQKFTEEHRSALDWLNRITDETFNFFGIEIELYKIGDSIPAPMFNIVSKPNDWAKSVRKSTSNQNLTDTKVLQKEYWGNLKEYLISEKSSVKMQNPLPQHWANLAIGKSNFNISTLVNSQSNTISIILYINKDKSKVNFDKLYALCYQDSLTKISKDIIWDRMDEKIQSCISLKTNGNFYEKQSWTKQFEWFKIHLEKFDNFFRPIIKTIQ